MHLKMAVIGFLVQRMVEILKVKEQNFNLFFFFSPYPSFVRLFCILCYYSRTKHIKGSVEHYLLGQNTTCKFWG